MYQRPFGERNALAPSLPCAVAEMGLTETVSMKASDLLHGLQGGLLSSPPFPLSLALSAKALLTFPVHLKHSSVFHLLKILQGHKSVSLPSHHGFSSNAPPCPQRGAQLTTTRHGSPQSQSTQSHL